MFSRRVFLGSAAAAAVGACTSTVGGPASMPEIELGGPSLNELAMRKGMRFGNAIAAWGEQPAAVDAPRSADPFMDEAYMDIVKKECGILVGENEFKRYTIQPVPGDYRFARADKIAKFARDNNMGLRGHTLVWNRNDFLPQWVQDLDLDAAGAEAHLSKYMGDVIGRYQDDIYSWDVCNETIDPETGELRDTVFTQALGDRVIDVMFEIAREKAPNTHLVYNDYMSWEKHSATHRKGILKLLEGLVSRGVPIQALGIQGHLGTYTGDPVTGFSESHDPKDWEFFLNEVTGMGLDIIITEFDVNDERLTADPAKRDQLVADYARDYLDMTLAYPQVKEVLAWGMVDHHSWLREWWPREDDALKRPTPYDDQYQPKLLRQALADAFRAAPMRDPLVQI